MDRIVRLAARLLLILFGYVVASLVASAFFYLIFLATTGFEPGQGQMVATASLSSILFVALYVANFAFIPAAVVVLAGEVLARRDWLFYALGGGLCGAVLMGFVDRGVEQGSDALGIAVLVAGGIVGGMAYWATAGRRAGGWRAPGASGPTAPASSRSSPRRP